jgi:GTPase
MTGGVGVVVVVGRPNVGKSALFNRLVGAQRAIVDDVPGVTRDRLVAVASHGDRRFLCVDTGGFHADPDRSGALSAQVRETALAAVEEGDVIVCVVDGQSGALPDDVALVRLLMRTGKPLVIAVNKLDVPSQDALLADFHRAGVAEVIATSAAHRRGITELLDAVVAKLPDTPAEPAPPDGATRVALIGRSFRRSRGRHGTSWTRASSWRVGRTSSSIRPAFGDAAGSRIGSSATAPCGRWRRSNVPTSSSWSSTPAKE